MSAARWTSLAQGDLAALDDESSQRGAAYAYRVGSAALAAGRFLTANPMAGPVFDGSLRKWRVRSTEYVLIYRVVTDGVEIIRLEHARRDWRPRRP